MPYECLRPFVGRRVGPNSLKGLLKSNKRIELTLGTKKGDTRDKRNIPCMGVETNEESEANDTEDSWFPE